MATTTYRNTELHGSVGGVPGASTVVSTQSYIDSARPIVFVQVSVYENVTATCENYMRWGKPLQAK